MADQTPIAVAKRVYPEIYYRLAEERIKALEEDLARLRARLSP